MHGDKNEEPSQTPPSSQSRHPSLPPRPSAAGAVQPGPRPAVRQSLQHSAMTHPLPPRPTPSPVPFDTTLLRYADDGDSSSRVAKEPSLTPMAVSQEVSKSEDSASQEPALATQSPSSDLVPNPLKRKLEDDTAAAEITETIVQPKPTVIPILPTPLPSKRFKKGAHSKALLIPVEQLPVFALPPLPVITDPILLTQVFNHQSLFGRHRGRFEDAVDKPQMDYEKLEHVGDSILGMVVTTWLQETKPGLTCGTASKLKSHLVSNATLSHISGLYNLPSRLKGDPNQLPVLRALTDVRAAMVEAYIAALYFSSPADKRMTEALPMIDSWLREMYEPLYDFFFTYMKAEYEKHRNAIGENPDGTVQTISEEDMKRIDDASTGMAALLKVYGNTHDRKVEYDDERYDTNLGILYRVTVRVDDVELGEATRANKKTAKNVAAWEAAKLLGLAPGH